MNILVVDDSQIMRNILKNNIAQLNNKFSVFEASDGNLAYSVIESNKISLLLLDWNMPNFNGLDLVKKIRNSNKYMDLPIIMITSESAKYNMVEAVKAGVDDYIVKPVSGEILQQKINRIIQDENNGS